MNWQENMDLWAVIWKYISYCIRASLLKGMVDMLLHIAVCDDDESDLNSLLSHLTAVCADLELLTQIDTFTSGEYFLSACIAKNYDIVFMDIYMNDINGIDAVRGVQMRRPQTSHYVFTTISSEHAIEAFNLNAAHYLVKPLKREKVREAVERCISFYPAKNKRSLEIKTGRKQITIPMEDITYIEVTNTRCDVHTEDHSFQTYSSLNALFKLLDEGLFLRVQKSFVVNMAYIDSFFYDHIVLKDGTEISISRNKRAELKKQYQDILFRYVRRQGS